METVVAKISQIAVESLEAAREVYRVTKSMLLFRKMVNEAHRKIVSPKKRNFIGRYIYNIRGLLSFLNANNLIAAFQVGQSMNTHDRRLTEILKDNDDLRRQLEQSEELRLKFWNELSQPAFFRQIFKGFIKFECLSREEEKKAMQRLNFFTEQIFHNC